MADLRMLRALKESPAGRARMGDLAAALQLLPCRLTRQARRLEGQGLVQRCVSPEDRRGVVVIITAAGRLMADRATTTYAQNVRAVFLDSLSRSQIGAMKERCNRIATPLKQ
jgi:DNA-binding MarR family transcriptional regulator